MEFPEVVELNVGGRHMSTLLSTLTKYPDSMLAAMFSGRHHVTKDKDGRFFIDADGDIFSHLLNFLRFETMPLSDKATQLKEYAVYFGIDELKTRLNEINLQDSYIEKRKANIPRYSEYLSFVKEQLMTGNFQIGYIALIVRTAKSSEVQITNAELPVHMKDKDISQLEINVDRNFSMRFHYENLLTLLAHDLKQCGLCTEVERTKSRCQLKTIILLKVL